MPPSATEPPQSSATPSSSVFRRAPGTIIVGLIALVAMAYFVARRPFTGASAVVVALFIVYRLRRIAREAPHAIQVRVILAAIAGGIAGEALSYAMFSLPPGAPTDPASLVVGALGMGGAWGVFIGIGVSMLVVYLPWRLSRRAV